MNHGLFEHAVPAINGGFILGWDFRKNGIEMPQAQRQTIFRLLVQRFGAMITY